MSCAYTAVADDATAPFWNPAGLVQLGAQEFLASHANLFGSSLSSDYIGLALPLGGRSAGALQLNHLGYDDEELRFGETQFAFSLATRAAPWLAVGASGRYTSRDTRLDGTAAGASSGWGADLGLLMNPLPGLRLGLVSQDAVETKIRYGDGSQAKIYLRNLRCAASWAPWAGTLVALDVDDRVHLGAEMRPLRQVALRGGLEREPSGNEGTFFSTGLGLEVGALRFDYAYVEHPALGGTSHFQLATSFTFNPPLLRIEEVRTRDLYASLYKSYAREPVASVRLRSLTDRPLTARVSATLPGFTEAAVTRVVTVRPRATEDVELTSMLSSKIMEGRELRQVALRVAARYQSHRLPREERVTATPFLYATGAIRWDLGVEQAAAFVTPRDAEIEGLAVQACRVAASIERSESDGVRLYYDPQLGCIAAVLDALAVLGLTYVADPRIPNAVDVVHYPRETLARRAGDCDDTSVLVASLLASVGVATKFADAPGHLFLIADTGLGWNERAVLGVPDSVLVPHGGSIWIPLETTRAGDGFVPTWREGMVNLPSVRAPFVDVDSARALYTAPDRAQRHMSSADLDTLRLRRLLETSAREIRALRREALFGGAPEEDHGFAAGRQILDRLAQVCEDAGRNGEAARFRNWWSSATEPIERPEHSARELRFGVAMALTHSLAVAESAFVSALSHRASWTAALVDLGNLYMLRNDPALAAAFYREALDEDGSQAGTRANLALAMLLSGDEAAARKEAKLAGGLAGGHDALARLLKPRPIETQMEAARAAALRLPPYPTEGPTLDEAAIRRLFSLEETPTIEPPARGGPFADRAEGSGRIRIARALDWRF